MLGSFTTIKWESSAEHLLPALLWPKLHTKVPKHNTKSTQARRSNSFRKTLVWPTAKGLEWTVDGSVFIRTRQSHPKQYQHQYFDHFSPSCGRMDGLQVDRLVPNSFRCRGNCGVQLLSLLCPLYYTVNRSTVYAEHWTLGCWNKAPRWGCPFYVRHLDYIDTPPKLIQLRVHCANASTTIIRCTQPILHEVPLH